MMSFLAGAGLSIAAWALPLLLVVMLAARRLRPLALACAPWASLPAWVVALGLHARGALASDWALLGVRFNPPGALTRGFLLLTACVWLASSWYARAYLAGDPRRARFWAFFLATSSGNFGLILAGDVATFYAFYALMTFAAYGLMVHTRTEPARRAGRVYLSMALIGEMLLLSAFLFIVGADINLRLEEVPRAVADSATPALLVALLAVGFGIKAGAFLLHMWLPLAHPVAPTPASAVLSGAMIKAGVLGWLRFLPLGLVSLPALGLSCVVAGLAAAFGAAAIGATQRDPKTVLAYSSVSQMGLVTAVLGVALANREAAATAVAAILLFVMHHALVKGALFLAVGVASAATSTASTWLVSAGMLAAAASLAGAPLSSGALAKMSLDHALAQAPFAPASLSWLLSFAAIGSTLLMVQYLRHALPGSTRERQELRAGLWVPWVLLLVLQVVLVYAPFVASEEPAHLLRAGKLWAATWPLATGAGVAAVAWQISRRGARIVEVPAGDVLLGVELLLAKLQPAASAAKRRVELSLRRAGAWELPLGRLYDGLTRAAQRAEASLAAFTTLGLMSMLVLGFLLALLFSSELSRHLTTG